MLNKLTTKTNTDKDILIILSQIMDYLLLNGDFNGLINVSKQLQLQTITIESLSDYFGSMKLEILSYCQYSMLPLKKCYENGIRFGNTCNESNIIYLFIYIYVQPNGLTISIYCKTPTNNQHNR
jgi:hypothetical protein